MIERFTTRKLKDESRIPKWSILICSLDSRDSMLNQLFEVLKGQIYGAEANVEVIALITDEKPSIGEKRNWLLAEARGEYISFFDDDDKPSSDYVYSIYEALKENPDVVTFNGDYKFRNEKELIWRLRLGAKRETVYTTLKRVDSYIAPPNHIAVTKKSIVDKYKFQEINLGEDTDWADQIAKDGVLKTEVYLDKILYHYVFTK